MNVIEKILKESKVVAVVGISNKPDRPSFAVAQYLKERGYTLIPVNPMIQEVHGEKSYPDLASIPVRVDVVDVFRKSEDVPGVVADAVNIGAKAIWMQEGVVSEEAKRTAEAAGLLVVMDRCMLKEHQKLYGVS